MTIHSNYANIVLEIINNMLFMSVGDVMDMKGLLAAAAYQSRFLDAYGLVRRKITNSQVAVLMYHRVSPKEYSCNPESISPQNFEKQMGYFSRNYEILSLERLVEYMKQREPLPEKAVVITLDDGYKDNYRYAYPILKKYKIPATIFLATGHIGTGDLFWWDKVGYIIQHTSLDQLNLGELGTFSCRSERDKLRVTSIITERLKTLPEEEKDLLIDYLHTIARVEIPDDLGKELNLSWDEVQEMSANGIAFGAHTVNHTVLTNLPFEQAELEIIRSKKDIEKMIGHQVTAFSYPHGDFDTDIVEFVRRNGFVCAVAISPDKLIGPRDSVYELARIGVMENSSKFNVMFCGLWGDLKVASHRLKRT